MEFRGVRRVNKPQSGLFSSHYYNRQFWTTQGNLKAIKIVNSFEKSIGIFPQNGLKYKYVIGLG